MKSFIFSLNIYKMIKRIRKNHRSAELKKKKNSKVKKDQFGKDFCLKMRTRFTLYLKDAKGRDRQFKGGSK